MKTDLERKYGFSLVEVTVALGICALSLLPLLGLLPVGLKNNQNAFEQTAAANLATAVATDLKNTPLTDSVSPRFKFTIPTSSSGSQPQALFFQEDGEVLSSASGGNSAPRYRVTVGIPTSPGASKTVRILVTWPALADTSTTEWPKNFVGSFETMLFINR